MYALFVFAKFAHTVEKNFRNIYYVDRDESTGFNKNKVFNAYIYISDINCRQILNSSKILNNLTLPNIVNYEFWTKDFIARKSLFYR